MSDGIMINMRLEAHYKSEVSLLLELNHSDSYGVFWTWVAELLTECFNPDMTITGMNDVMGIIMHKIKGSNEGCEVIHLVESDRSKYDNYLREYGVAKSIEDCGDFYKKIINGNDESKKETIVIVFTDYVKTVAPYVFEESAEWLLLNMNEYFNDKKIAEAKKNYRKYIAKYKSLIKALQ